MTMGRSEGAVACERASMPGLVPGAPSLVPVVPAGWAGEVEPARSEALSNDTSPGFNVGRPGVARDKGPGAPPDVTVGRQSGRGVEGHAGMGSASGPDPVREASAVWVGGMRPARWIRQPRGAKSSSGAGLKPGRPLCGLTAQTAGNRAGGNMRGVEDSGARTTRSASSGPPDRLGAVRRATSEGE